MTYHGTIARIMKYVTAGILAVSLSTVSTANSLLDSQLHEYWQTRDFSTVFPTANAVIDKVVVNDGAVTVFLTARSSWLENMTGDDIELVSIATRPMIEDVPEIEGLRFQIRAEGATRYRALVDYLPPVPDFEPFAGLKVVPTQYTRSTRPDREHNRPVGALTGATVFLSPGHGWYYADKLGRWATQRGNSHGVVEDHSNGEAVLQFLTKYLWNAGAEVVTTRERDMQTNMVIVEPGKPGYSQVGAWMIEQNRAARDGEQRVADTTTGEPTAYATFAPEIPETGNYAVYVRYQPSRTGSTTRDADFVINHSGGTTRWTQNQNHDGYTWRYVGTYHFEAGHNPDSASVVISNRSQAGGRVVVDAVRFGGGMGDVSAGEHGVSGKPRWEESGYYYAKFMGFDDSLETRRYSTVSAMPLYAEWEAEEWEAGRCIYVSWHTNAHNGKARGLFSFVYGPNSWGDLTEFQGYPGGDVLLSVVHDEIANDITKTYDPDWRIGPKVCRWLGETNPRYNNKMPAALFEMGFHDNAEDAQYIVDPEFRRIVARAVYQGIVRYYYENVEGFDIPTLLPEPPTHLRVTTDYAGKVTLQWNEPPYDTGDGVIGDPPLEYRVYRSTNGKGWDNGVLADGNRLDLTGLVENKSVYFRVAAVNVGGESMPTETLVVRASTTGRPEVLIVNGFDRLDREMNLTGEADEERGILSKMNTFDYCIQHADAIATTGRSFDSVSNEAVEAGQVDLTKYRTVVWILGREAGESEVFSVQERRAIRGFADTGGSLFVSGANVAEDLARTPDGKTFLREVLMAEFVGPSAGSNIVKEAAGSMFEGVGFVDYGDLEESVYPVESADVIRPAGGAKAALLYSSDSGTRIAGIQGAAKHGIVYFGFPFESITDLRKRASIMSRALFYLDSRPQVEDTTVGGG